MNYEQLNDKEIVKGILNDDKPLITYFFTQKCLGLVRYILRNVFDNNIKEKEIINELYLFLAQNNWQIFRQFQFRSSLMTYVSVVASRFFLIKRDKLIDSKINIAPIVNESIIHNTIRVLEQRIDIREALKKMQNERYRKVIELLDLKDIHPETVAKEMNITVDNLYNIHRRALIQLRHVMGRKEEYV